MIWTDGVLMRGEREAFRHGECDCQTAGGKRDWCARDDTERLLVITAQRVAKLRNERAGLGLKRRELYAHDDDWPKLQELAAKLQRKRERDAKRAKG